jgi:SagB-type dehydrogenase family enzyme
VESYHPRTAYRREAMSGGYLDWANQPRPFKRYLGLEPRPLPPPRLPRAGFWPLALGWPPPEQGGSAGLGEDGLAGLLALSAGITAQGGGGVHLRAPASAGALYPAELYLTASGLEWLPDGLWHYAPDRHGLHALRPGKLAGAAARVLGGPPRELNFFITGLFWRSAWKYKTRAWRYCLLDGGHLLANLELALAAHGLGQRLSLDPAAAPGRRLLGLDPEREALLAGFAAGDAAQDPGPVPPPAWEPPPEEPLSPDEQRDPVIARAAALGQLAEPGPAPVWPPDPAPPGAAALAPRPPEPGPGLVPVMAKRRSRRNFLAQGLEPGQLALLLAAALPADGPLGATVLLGPGLEAGPGVYGYHPASQSLSQVAQRDQRRAVARASLGQMWVGQAALNLVLWADPARLERAAGDRGYRHAMLAAGRAGQRLYLAATALGLGCCGVGAFYDRELAAAALLPPGAWPLYLLATGPVKAADSPC